MQPDIHLNYWAILVAVAATMVLGFLWYGSFLTVFVLAHTGEVWRPSVWKAGADGSAAFYGFTTGFLTWIGFYVPLLLGAVAWESKSWKLFGINAAYYFVMLQMVAMILAFWR